MFEKESKEYANKWLYHVKDLELHHKEDDKPEYIRIEEAYQKGAEFGFKECAKARLNVTTISDCPIKDEWHYVKNGDYPKEKCLAIVFHTAGQVQCYSVLEITEEVLKECDSVTVIAWKEIVPPKEIE